MADISQPENTEVVPVAEETLTVAEPSASVTSWSPDLSDASDPVAASEPASSDSTDTALTKSRNNETQVTGEQTVSDPSTASDVASEQPAVTDEPGTEAESRQRTSAGRSGTGSGAKALGPGDRTPRSEQYPIFSLRYPSRRLRMDVREDLTEARAAGALRWSPETAQGSSPLFSMIGR